MSRKAESAELDKIFSDMKKLYDEMAKWRDDEDNHQSVFLILAELGRSLVGAERVSFWRWDKRAKKLVTTVATESDELAIDEGTGIVGRALRENRTLVINDPHSHPDFTGKIEKQTGYEIRSMLVMPVVNFRGETIGAFQALNKLSGESFDESEDVRRLSVAAFICGLVLASDLFLNEARHDKLTGLKNRLCFYSDWHNKYRKITEEANGQLAFILCDIDYFKKINDTYGHNSGDEVLMAISGILGSGLPQKAAAYRWGGEEFLLIIPGKDLQETAYIAEALRQKIAQKEFFFDGTALRVTMSFGCAVYDSSYSLDENIATVDARLYLAKNGGRNCVVSTDEGGKGAAGK